MKTDSCLKESQKAVTSSPKTEDTSLTSEQLLIALTSVPTKTESLDSPGSLNQIKSLSEETQLPRKEPPPTVTEPLSESKLLTAPLKESELVTTESQPVALSSTAPIEALLPTAPIEALLTMPIETPLPIATIETPLSTAPIEAPLSTAPIETPIEAPLPIAPIETSVEAPLPIAPIEAPLPTVPIEVPLPTAPIEAPLSSPVAPLNEIQPTLKETIEPVQKTTPIDPSLSEVLTKEIAEPAIPKTTPSLQENQGAQLKTETPPASVSKEETVPSLKVEPPPLESPWVTEPVIKPSVSPKVTASSLSQATSLAFNNLPEISAALRRLSHSGVMEHLTGEPKKTSIDASPSEILGNALAAVAASARANSHPEDTQHTTATAIGNLAAITANISNILTSSGFSRGSFSQEDTQKLAAAVVGGTPSSPKARRNTAVGNAFSSMIDQAIQIRRHHTQLAAAPRPKLVVKNDQVWKALEGLEEKRLGYHLYTPQKLLPCLEHALNGLVEVRIPAKYLSFENAQVKKKALWGTDIYTDDSDIVAMIIHSGKYQPEFKEPDIQPNDPFALAIAGKSKEAMEASKKLVLSGQKWSSRPNIPLPDHDLKVTLRVLPRLQLYTGSIRHCLKSRDWGKHDGVSLFVHKIEKIKRGEARLRGRSSLKATMFAYEPYRKQALIMGKEEKPKEGRTQTGRVKKSPKAMQALRFHSKNN